MTEQEDHDQGRDDASSSEETGRWEWGSLSSPYARDVLSAVLMQAGQETNSSV